MMGKSAGLVLITSGFIGLACASLGSHDELVEDRAALYGGTSVPDASSVGTVWIQHLENETDTVGCNAGTGIAITNDVILTAGHVVDWQFAQTNCGGKTTKWLRLEMPDPSQSGQKQVRILSCAGASKTACGGRFPGAYNTPTTNSAFENLGIDVAILRTGGSGFQVAGQTAFYRRPLSERPTSELHNKQVTCYGMSHSKVPICSPCAVIGQLRKAEFTVLTFPQPPLANQHLGYFHPWLPIPHVFITARGGGTVPTSNVPHSTDTNPDPIMVSGDSGGPCIEHTSGNEGAVVGVLHGSSGEQSGGAPAPRWNHFTAASGFRDWVRSRLKQQGYRFALDLDGDGNKDDGIEVRVSAAGTLVVVATFNDGAQESPLDTLLPAGIADVGGTFGGDFDGDGADDIVATMGAAASAVPYYFKGGTSFAFNNVTTWQPSGPYEYFTVGRFDGDSSDDVAAVRFDGTQDLFLGQKNVGLTVPAQFVPRGFNWYGPEFDEESFAISAPGLDSSTGFWAGQPIDDTSGRVYFVANQGPGFEVYPFDLDTLKAEAPSSLTYTSTPGDSFGESLTWGNFDGDTRGAHALVIGAPRVSVGVHQHAGMFTYFKSDPEMVCPEPLNQTGECAKQPILVRQLDRSVLSGQPAADAFFSRNVAAGDFDGDGLDDLAVTSFADLHVIYGKQGVGLAPGNPQTRIDWTTLGVSDFAHAGWETDSLTTGDFNCDGYEDIAFGAPRELVGSAPDGAVIVLYGSTTGVRPELRQRIDKLDLGSAAAGADGFGWSLTAGNFNGDSFVGRPCVDLAIGANEGTGSIRNGAVYVVYGGSQGLRGEGSQRLVQGGPAAGNTVISDQSEPGDGFGAHLAITRADLDRFDDLIIGAFNENLAEGAAHVLRGSAQGITAAGQAYWRQGDPKIGESPETLGGHPLTIGDRFGWNVGGTSNGLVIVGASWESFLKPPVVQAGWAALIRLDDSKANSVEIQGSAFHATEASLTSGGVPLRSVAFFGQQITRARPAFVGVTQPPPRYAGDMVLTSGKGLRGPCHPDATPPVLGAVTATPACLWPPNNRLVAFQLGGGLNVAVHDACDPAPQVRIVSVTSSETAHPSDMVVTDGRACLRSRRNGPPPGRAYTVTVEARDAAGNVSQKSVEVRVPQHKEDGCPALPSSAFGCP